MFEESMVEIDDKVEVTDTFDGGKIVSTRYADGRVHTVFDDGHEQTQRNVRPFDGEEIQFKVIRYHGDREESFAILDKFGKFLTDSFKEIKCIVPYNHSDCIVIGTSIDGEKIAQRLCCGTYYPEDSCAFDIEFPSPIHEVSYVDEKTLLFGTDAGYCLVDSTAGWGNFPQKSDFFSKEKISELLQSSPSDEKPKTLS